MNIVCTVGHTKNTCLNLSHLYDFPDIIKLNATSNVQRCMIYTSQTLQHWSLIMDSKLSMGKQYFKIVQSIHTLTTRLLA